MWLKVLTQVLSPKPNTVALNLGSALKWPLKILIVLRCTRDCDLIFLGSRLSMRNFLIAPDVSNMHQGWESLQNSFLNWFIEPVNEAEISQLPQEQQESKSLEQWLVCHKKILKHAIPAYLVIYMCSLSNHRTPVLPLPPLQKIQWMFLQLRSALMRESSTLESSREVQGCLYARCGEWGGHAAVELGPDFNGNNRILVWGLGGSNYNNRPQRRGEMIQVSDLKESGCDLLIRPPLGTEKMGNSPG